MIPKRRVFIITIILLIFFLVTTNYFFVSVLSRTESEVMKKPSGLITIEQKIMQKVPLVSKNYKSKRITNDNTTDTFIRNLKIIKEIKNKERLWKEAKSWVSKTQLYNFTNPNLGSVLNALKTSKIIKADIDTRGTQLKLLLTLEVS